MIARLRLIARLITFAAAMWILAAVIWALATGAKGVTTPVVWLFIGGMIAQLILWLISRMARSA